MKICLHTAGVDEDHASSSTSVGWKTLRGKLHKGIVGEDRAEAKAGKEVKAMADLDGYWIDVQGSPIATVFGNTIVWRGGPVGFIERMKNGGFSTCLADWGRLFASLQQDGLPLHSTAQRSAPTMTFR